MPKFHLPWWKIVPRSPYIIYCLSPSSSQTCFNIHHLASFPASPHSLNLGSMSSYTLEEDLWIERSRLIGMILGGVSYGVFSDDIHNSCRLTYHNRRIPSPHCAISGCSYAVFEYSTRRNYRYSSRPDFLHRHHIRIGNDKYWCEHKIYGNDLDKSSRCAWWSNCANQEPLPLSYQCPGPFLVSTYIIAFGALVLHILAVTFRNGSCKLCS